jgi:hypothetical protein
MCILFKRLKFSCGCERDATNDEGWEFCEGVSDPQTGRACPWYPLSDYCYPPDFERDFGKPAKQLGKKCRPCGVEEEMSRLSIAGNEEPAGLAALWEGMSRLSITPKLPAYLAACWERRRSQVPREPYEMPTAPPKPLADATRQ